MMSRQRSRLALAGLLALILLPAGASAQEPSLGCRLFPLGCPGPAPAPPPPLMGAPDEQPEAAPPPPPPGRHAGRHATKHKRQAHKPAT